MANTGPTAKINPEVITMLYLFDISNHQGWFDVDLAIKEGYSGGIFKSSEGTTYRDPTFAQNVAACRNAGGVPGAYHFLRNGEGAEEARIFHRVVTASGGPDGMLCVCDTETDATWTDVQAFYAEWNRLTGNHPLIMYSGAWWWQPRGWPGATLTPYLWHSHYVSGTGYGSALYASVPASYWSPGYGGWSRATILQFSESATVTSRSPIDVNAFDGSIDDLRALTHAGTTTPIGADDMAGETADYAASNVPNPVNNAPTGLHVAVGDIWRDVESAGRDAADALAVAKQTLALVQGMTVGGIDPEILAAALAPYLPAAPTAGEIATAVNQDASKRMAS
jgi:GH25 family lysozyme M1 (1,4-beta-N-acetylmuramidase)